MTMAEDRSAISTSSPHERCPNPTFNGSLSMLRALFTVALIRPELSQRLMLIPRYAEADMPPIIKEVTRLIERGLDGKARPLNEGHLPPRHAYHSSVWLTGRAHS
jgi:hypothetical protein